MLLQFRTLTNWYNVLFGPLQLPVMIYTVYRKQLKAQIYKSYISRKLRNKAGSLIGIVPIKLNV